MPSQMTPSRPARSAKRPRRLIENQQAAAVEEEVEECSTRNTALSPNRAVASPAPTQNGAAHKDLQQDLNSGVSESPYSKRERVPKRNSHEMVGGIESLIPKARNSHFQSPKPSPRTNRGAHTDAGTGRNSRTSVTQSSPVITGRRGRRRIGVEEPESTATAMEVNTPAAGAGAETSTAGAGAETSTAMEVTESEDVTSTIAAEEVHHASNGVEEHEGSKRLPDPPQPKLELKVGGIEGQTIEQNLNGHRIPNNTPNKLADPGPPKNLTNDEEQKVDGAQSTGKVALVQHPVPPAVLPPAVVSSPAAQPSVEHPVSGEQPPPVAVAQPPPPIAQQPPPAAQQPPLVAQPSPVPQPPSVPQQPPPTAFAHQPSPIAQQSPPIAQQPLPVAQPSPAMQPPSVAQPPPVNRPPVALSVPTVHELVASQSMHITAPMAAQMSVAAEQMAALQMAMQNGSQIWAHMVGAPIPCAPPLVPGHPNVSGSFLAGFASPPMPNNHNVPLGMMPFMSSECKAAEVVPGVQHFSAHSTNGILPEAAMRPVPTGTLISGAASGSAPARAPHRSGSGLSDLPATAIEKPATPIKAAAPAKLAAVTRPSVEMLPNLDVRAGKLVMWTPVDDFVLMQSVEKGLSLSAIAVQMPFTSPFTAKDLELRWHSILYDPEIAAEVAMEISALEHSTSVSRPALSGKKALKQAMLGAQERRGGGCLLASDLLVYDITPEQAMARGCLVIGPSTSFGALAALDGCKVHYIAYMEEIAIGRSPLHQENKQVEQTAAGVGIDVDMSKDGDAQRVSRRHAVISRDAKKNWSLNNVGKGVVHVNGLMVASGAKLELSKRTLIVLGGLRIVFTSA